MIELKLKVLFLLLFFFLPAKINASVLGDLARNMPVGSWATLNTDGDGSGCCTTVFDSGGGRTIFEWTSKFVWDPVTRKAFYRGAGHLGQEKLISYDEATNTWSVLQNIGPASGLFHHSYETNAINPTAREMYFRPYSQYPSGMAWVKYNLDSGAGGAFTAMPANNLVQYAECCVALEYFPERNSVVWVNGQEFSPPAGGVYEFNIGTQTWSTVGQATQIGQYDVFATYNRIHKLILFGGGEPGCSASCGTNATGTELWTMSQTGVLTRKNNAPFRLGIAGGGAPGTVQTVDPVSGNHLFLVSDGTFRSYNPITDTWTTISSGFTAPPYSNQTPRTFDVIAAPISTHGVVMFLTSEGGNKVTLFKYADDFAQRCAQAGVIRCFNFDTTADFTNCSGGTNGCYGFEYGIISPNANGDYTKAVRDTTQAANGASSLRFTIPSNSGSDMAGSWHTNFSASPYATQFGGVGSPGGAEFYIQHRIRFSPCYLYQGTDDANCLVNHTPRFYTGGGGWKTSIIGTGDLAGNPVGSCTKQEVTANEYADQNGVHIIYHHCGDYQGFFPSFTNTAVGGFADTYLQNMRPAPSCSYIHTSAPGQFNDGMFPPGKGTCFPYYPNEWLTYQYGITLGPYQSSGCVQAYGNTNSITNCYKNSRVRVWMSRDGDATDTLVGDYTRDLHAENEANGNNKYGKVWLLPYHTGKSAAQAHPTGYMWFDDLIISTAKIAQPGTGGALAAVSDTTPPSNPSSLTATAVSTTQINLTWTASTDNVGGSGVTGYNVERCTGAGCSPTTEVYTPTTNSQNDTGRTASTTYGYRVRAHDGAGNLSGYSSSSIVYATTQAAVISPIPEITWINSRTGGSAVATGILPTWSANISLLPGNNPVTVTYTTATGSAQDSRLVIYAPSFPGNTLAGAWGFEASPGLLIDSSGNPNNLTAVNGATSTAQGHSRQGLALSGASQYVFANNSNSLQFTQSFTVSAWILPTALLSYTTVISKTFSATLAQFILYASATTTCGANTPALYVLTNGNLGPGDYVCSNTPLQQNQPTHLAASYDATAASDNLKLYVNGAQVATKTFSGYMEPSNLELRIGADVSGNFFQGTLDTIRLYNFPIPVGTNKPNTPCPYTDYTATVKASINYSLATIVDDMNCPVVPVTPPAGTKVPAGASALKVGAASKSISVGPQ